MNTISVKVEYNLPTTTKFDALLREYESAKALADATDKTLTPLIEVGGEARYRAILDQLSVIVEQAETIVRIKHEIVEVRGQYIDEYGYTKFMKIKAYSNHPTEILFADCCNFLQWDAYKDKLLAPNGLVIKWNNLRIIEQMQESCNAKMKVLIEKQQRKTQTITNTLNQLMD